MLSGGFRRALIVEDDAALGRTLQAAMQQRGIDARVCGSIGAAKLELLQPAAHWIADLLLTDVMLPDGSAHDLLHAMRAQAPRPFVIAISGQVLPEQCFELAQLGVQRFLPKPIDLATLEATLQRAGAQVPDLEVHLKQLVGKASLHDIESRARLTLVQEAMAKAGSVRAAARLLAISRQLLQHILRDSRESQ